MQPKWMATSSSTSAMEAGTHVFHVCGYRLLRGIGSGNSVRSGTFAAGGFHWSLRFFPDGETPGGGFGFGKSSRGGAADECSFRADLVTQGADARACFTLGLVDQTDGSTRWEPTTPLLSLSTAAAGNRSTLPPPPSARLAVPRSKVEDLAVLRGDRVSVVCRVAVAVAVAQKTNQPRRAVVVSSAAAEAVSRSSRVEVPPPDLPECLGRLLEEGTGADVTIRVGEDSFAAHRVVLAMRSPVFRAQLYGPMKDKGALTVEDMQPSVFRALLGFIYTDSLPLPTTTTTIDDDDDGSISSSSGSSMDELDRRERICHLLVAADRYAMERLKMICQGILCKTLAVDTVAAMLALADQYHCDTLKDSCFEFIFSHNRLRDVVASQGYAELKTTCPSVLVEILEKSSKYCQI